MPTPHTPHQSPRFDPMLMPGLVILFIICTILLIAGSFGGIGIVVAVAVGPLVTRYRRRQRELAEYRHAWGDW